MSEVHRYQVVQMFTEDGNKISYSPTGPWVVLESALISAETKLDAQRLRADTAEAELAKANKSADTYLAAWEKCAEFRDASEDKLKAAEQRIAKLVGKTAKCKECGSDALFWFAHNQSTNGIQHGRMTTHDITCVMVLGCAECSATIRTVSADKIAERMTAALNPNPEAESHE